MMNFDLLSNEEKVETENGALGYKTTKSKLLDMSFKVPAMRADAINGVDVYTKYFKEAYEENRENALRFLMYLRDARGGLGEREAFRNILINMAKDMPEMALNVFRYMNIPEYGRWDDMIEIGLSNKIFYHTLQYKLNSRFYIDDVEMQNHKSISLLAKWMPSISTSSKETQEKARRLAKLLGWKYSVYRKNLSKLRAYINIIERQMSANEWDTINYEHVPSKANLIYRKAFMRHDPERRSEYLHQLEEGKAKINAKVMAPYEIVREYKRARLGEDHTLEQLWNNLPAPKNQKNILVVRDGSYSMTSGPIKNLTPMDIGDSIALYMAQFNTGVYKNKFITFSATPKIVDVSNETTLSDKLKLLNGYTECSNTNLERVFELVLTTVIENKVPQEEIPDILIISDMEFDRGVDVRSSYDTLLNQISRKWEDLGYKIPRIIFWNVASRTNAIPMRENENGLVLLSGFSTSLADMVLNCTTDPLKALLDVLHTERYDPVNYML